MRILQNYDLTKFNTFGISVNAKFFVEVNDEPDLLELFTTPEFERSKKIFLGGGSNILFTKNFDGIVVLNKLKGMEVLEENDESVLVRSMGGEIWHDLVTFAVNHGYWGIENLSYIPGTVGAAPMQNIGAYGAELKYTLLNVEAFEIETGKENKKKIFSREECELGYRDSVFKNKLKGKYFISAITLKLSKISKPNLSYKILSDYMENLPARSGSKIKIHSPKDISDAVTAIRQSKLPDPKIIGNAGSFFKNVFVKKAQLAALIKNYPSMPFFNEGGITKIPAGWLIEQCGPASPRFGGAGGRSWKGYKEGSVGVHPKQALVLVNYGGATGHDILEFAQRIMSSVKQKFGLELLPEVNIV